MIKNAPSFMNFSLHVLEYGGEHFDFSQFADKLNFRTTRIESDRYVHPSARNLSVKRSIDENPAAEILMISDCDLIFKVNFWKNFIDISAHFNIRHGAADLGHGSVIISKSNFLKLRGYNELMSHGWGWDDCDLYERARNIGISEIAGWYENTCEEIKQDDYQRQVEFKTNLTLEQSNNMNKSIKEFNSIFK
jgi:hypothetical protein